MLKTRKISQKTIMLMLFFVTLHFLVLSCGDDGGSSSGSPLVGEWQTPCTLDGQYYKIKLIGFFPNSKYRYTEVATSDPNCNSGKLLTLSSSGYYNQVGTTSGGELQLDFSIEMIDLLVKDESLASDFSENNYCGVDDWEVEEARPVLGLRCSLGEEVQFESDEKQHLQVAEISEEGGVLYLGKKFLQALSERSAGVTDTAFEKL